MTARVLFAEDDMDHAFFIVRAFQDAHAVAQGGLGLGLEVTWDTPPLTIP